MRFNDKLKLVPELPGVYQMINDKDAVIYVGKARSLRNRLRSYFQAGAGHNAKVRAMVEKVADFEYIITDTEREALVLESNLIKELRPHYNIRIKDDKHYPYLRLSVHEVYPRLSIVRRVEKDKARYFGPYPNAGAVRDLLKLLKRVFPLHACSREFSNGKSVGRPCLNYHLKQCLGPCTGEVTEVDYRTVVRSVELLLEGKHDALLKSLREQMEVASDALDFERAAVVRDQVRAVENVVERQKFDAAKHLERDVVGMALSLEEACVVIFHMREGKVVGRETVFLTGTAEQNRDEVFSAFLVQFYTYAPYLPKEILLDEEPAEREEIEHILSAKLGSRVSVQVPQRGAKKAITDLASRNALQVLEERYARISGKQELAKRGLTELAYYLGLATPPQRIECYDISNIQGTLAVGSMVVFVDGLPAKEEYRRFRIKWVEGANDFAMLHEVLTRRLAAYKESNPKFLSLPDLLIIDGGKGQLSAASSALAQEEMVHLAVVSLAKADELIFVPGRVAPVDLPRDSQARYLVQRIRDEAHRFAITYHRQLRKKAQVASLLEDCPGIGPARRQALLKAFGSMTALKQATLDEVKAIKGMNEALARRLHDYLRGKA